MITCQVRKVRTPDLMVAVLDLLKRHYRSGYEVKKPRASLTYTLSVTGADKEAFLQDFKSVANAAGWQFVAEAVARK